jgi:Zn-dependent protease
MNESKNTNWFDFIRNYRIGSLFGFPIEINTTFLMMIAALVLIKGSALAGIYAVVMFMCVLPHELGHALTARRLGVNISGIRLYMFGGAAMMENQPKTANDDILISAAGPLVSFIVGLIFIGFGMYVDVYTTTSHELFTNFGKINIVIGIFNLIPAIPMDGGRIIRALLTRVYTYKKSTYISTWCARIIAFGFVVFGLAISSSNLLIISILVLLGSKGELDEAENTENNFAYDESGYIFSEPATEEIKNS